MTDVAALAGMRIGLLTASASRLGGGVFEAVAAHAAMIRSCGGDARIFTLADRHTADDAPRFSPSPVVAASVRGPAQIGFAPGLVARLIEARLDLLHLHGIWMYPSRAGLAWARRTGCPYVISPHGMLDPWITARGRAKKAAARLGYERAGWAAAAALHALTAREASDIERESGRGDSLVIPNAGPAAGPRPTVPRPPRIAYLGRIHAKKNLLALVEAWTLTTTRPGADPDARLDIAGWGDPADVAALEAAIARAPGSVRFHGPLYGEDKARLLREARFLVLPSHSEGLPMVVLEAWAAGTPALMTKECNLPEGFAAGAALDCGYEPAAIAAALGRALAIPAETWLGMAGAASALAAGPFDADTVAAKWAAAYRGLAGRDRVAA